MAKLSTKNNFLLLFPEIAAEWHPIKNNNQKPLEQFTSRSNIKVWWLCSKCGHEYLMSLDHRTGMLAGCSQCKKGKISSGVLQKALDRYKKNFIDWEGHGEIPGTFWKQILNSAKARNISFELTIKEAWDLFILQKNLCALSGLELHMQTGQKDRSFGRASLDRIDSNLPYKKENVQWVLLEINLMKQNFDQAKFKEFCRLVTEFRNKDNGTTYSLDYKF